MNVKYIVGRPFVLDGENVEPGDSLTKDQIEKIHNLNAWIGTHHIYRLHSEKDYGLLPAHVFSIVKTRKEAEAQIENKGVNTFPGTDESLAAYERIGTGTVPETAAKQMSVQDFLYERVLSNTKLKDEKLPKGTEVLSGTLTPGPVTHDEIAEAAKANEEPEPIPVENAEGDTVMGEVVADSQGESEDTDPQQEAKDLDVQGEIDFDPNEHTLPEVTEYLEEHPEKRKDVLRKEKAGKARKGVLGS